MSHLRQIKVRFTILKIFNWFYQNNANYFKILLNATSMFDTLFTINVEPCGFEKSQYPSTSHGSTWQSFVVIVECVYQVR